MRRALRGFSSVLILAGALLLADAGLTLVWQEPLSALYADVQQNQLGSDLRTLEALAPTPSELATLAQLRDAHARIAFLARIDRRRSRPGRALGRIRIARIHENSVLVEGTDTESLKKGPGHYPQTPLPGIPGTVAVAGHRTTYLAPFRRINELKRGDSIVLEMPYGQFTYSVEDRRIVVPTAVYVTRRVPYDRLVLTACHPLYSAAQRIVVFARLMLVEPRGPALRGA